MFNLLTCAVFVLGGVKESERIIIIIIFCLWHLDELQDHSFSERHYYLYVFLTICCA